MHPILYFSYSLSIIIISWALGASLNGYLKNKNIYRLLSNKVLIKNEFWNKCLGVNFFKLLVTKTVYGKINRLIKITNTDFQELVKIKEEMINSEIGHSIGLISAQISFFLIYSINGFEFFLLTGTILNIILNFYPILLQQKNKKRIDKILIKYSCRI